MYKPSQQLINDAQSIIVIQAENPDGDSLASALALEELLGDQGKSIHLYCPVAVPKYLRYINGWDRVTDELPNSADLIVIVDTAAEVLLSKLLEVPSARHLLETRPVIVIDHHQTESNLSFDHQLLVDPEAISTSEVIYDLAVDGGWSISQAAARHLLEAQLADSLGFTTQAVRPKSFQIAADLLDKGAHVNEIELARREFMKKSPEILQYKAKLIERIEYFLDGKLAVVHIPWEDIEKYSDQYNPSVLVLDEMRLVERVEVAIAIKTYPDGKLTGKLRSNMPVSETIAGYFGGGGHKYAAGFRTYENYQTILKELVEVTEKAINETV